MAKIFLGFAILFTLLAAVLGFLTKSKIGDIRANLATVTSARDAANQQLAKTKADLTAANSQIDTLKQQEQALTKNLSDTQAALDTANKDKEDLQKQMADAQTQIKALNDKLSMNPSSAGPATVSNPADAAKIQELETKVKENDQINKKLTEQNAEIQSKLDDYIKERKRVSSLAYARTLTGQVLAVQPSWNFVIVSLGDRQGVTMNSPFLVKRGGILVAKLKVTSVEPATSVADIVPSSVPKGMHVEPGDRVVYAAP